jgi:hypothetical protein
MASMKRIKIDLLALGLAAATMTLFADHADPRNNTDSKRLTPAQARAESARYLDGPAVDTRLHRAAGRWAVTDGSTTAWLDARTGELLEVELQPSR